VFDRNIFKKSVKQWVRSNPGATVQQLVDYCEELIPPAEYSANSWMIDQTIHWYKNFLSSQEFEHEEYELEDEPYGMVS
jgi:hypothetical protein